MGSECRRLHERLRWPGWFQLRQVVSQCSHANVCRAICLSTFSWRVRKDGKEDAGISSLRSSSFKIRRLIVIKYFLNIFCNLEPLFEKSLKFCLRIWFENMDKNMKTLAGFWEMFVIFPGKCASICFLLWNLTTSREILCRQSRSIILNEIHLWNNHKKMEWSGMVYR